MALKFRWESRFKKTEIGEIPEDWEVKKLGEVIFINKKPENNGDKPIGFISMENIPEDGLYPKFEVKNRDNVKSGVEVPPNSLLLAKITPSFEHGKSCIVPNNTNYKWMATTEVFSILPKNNKIDKLYLFYFLKIPSVRKGLQYTMTGTSGRQRVPKSALEQLLVPYPSPEEQTRIATVLSWFDDLIENKRRQNEILEKMAMAIFKSWFIDFEPFKDEEFVYSEELDMEIPEGWEVKPIGETVDILYGKGLPKSKREKGRFPVVGSSGIIGYHTQFLATAPSVVIGRKGNVGSVYLMLEPFYPIDTVFYTTGTNPAVTFYIYHHLKLIPLAELGSSDTAVPGININNLKAVKFPIPPQPILQRFHSLVEPLFQKILLNQREIMLLKKIRDALLPQLVFGRLRVEEV
ncbi:hypothetical protein A3L12_01340 [Thermococcus sp. P6]|uniref:restriction endonuclease subunit S n=1 Tax=Thermococcus sp. P6 TaxID=122420 RepID=UPI000B59CF1B|nr:restriction endonuclease subunit S [Thermococcus sp. P6]ASJ10037.1 hypothetical protein A3L12_01340 [Thermococcus sp. P6]